MKKIACLFSLIFAVFLFNSLDAKNFGTVIDSEEKERTIEFSDYDCDGMCWPYNYHVRIEYELTFEDGKPFTWVFLRSGSTSYDGQDDLEYYKNFYENLTILPGDTMNADIWMSNPKTDYFYLHVDPRLKEFQLGKVSGYYYKK